MSESAKARLAEVRLALLALHKVLLEAERASYEKTVGTIPSPNHFLRLLTSDPWFAWLQPLSRLIVSLDEIEEADEPVTDATVDSVVNATRSLLSPSESGEGFGRHYFDSLQGDPVVVIAHVEVMRLLGRPK
jgi:hypothetical protein